MTYHHTSMPAMPTTAVHAIPYFFYDRPRREMTVIRECPCCAHQGPVVVTTPGANAPVQIVEYVLWWATVTGGFALSALRWLLRYDRCESCGERLPPRDPNDSLDRLAYGVHGLFRRLRRGAAG